MMSRNTAVRVLRSMFNAHSFEAARFGGVISRRNIEPSSPSPSRARPDVRMNCTKINIPVPNENDTSSDVPYDKELVGKLWGMQSNDDGNFEGWFREIEKRYNAGRKVQDGDEAKKILRRYEGEVKRYRMEDGDDYVMPAATEGKEDVAKEKRDAGLDQVVDCEKGQDGSLTGNDTISVEDDDVDPDFDEGGLGGEGAHEQSVS